MLNRDVIYYKPFTNDYGVEYELQLILASAAVMTADPERVLMPDMICNSTKTDVAYQDNAPLGMPITGLLKLSFTFSNGNEFIDAIENSIVDAPYLPNFGNLRFNLWKIYNVSDDVYEFIGIQDVKPIQKLTVNGFNTKFDIEIIDIYRAATERVSFDAGAFPMLIWNTSPILDNFGNLSNIESIVNNIYDKTADYLDKPNLQIMLDFYNYKNSVYEGEGSPLGLMDLTKSYKIKLLDLFKILETAAKINLSIILRQATTLSVSDNFNITFSGDLLNGDSLHFYKQTDSKNNDFGDMLTIDNLYLWSKYCDYNRVDGEKVYFTQSGFLSTNNKDETIARYKTMFDFMQAFTEFFCLRGEIYYTENKVWVGIKPIFKDLENNTIAIDNREMLVNEQYDIEKGARCDSTNTVLKEVNSENISEVEYTRSTTNKSDSSDSDAVFNTVGKGLNETSDYRNITTGYYSEESDIVYIKFVDNVGAAFTSLFYYIPETTNINNETEYNIQKVHENCAILLANETITHDSQTPNIDTYYATLSASYDVKSKYIYNYYNAFINQVTKTSGLSYVSAKARFLLLASPNNAVYTTTMKIRPPRDGSLLYKFELGSHLESSIFSNAYNVITSMETDLIKGESTMKIFSWGGLG